MPVIASLRIYHPTAKLDEFVSLLGLRPKHIWKAGDMFEKGTSIAVQERASSYATVSLAPKGSLQQTIEPLVQLLSGNARLIGDFSKSGGRLALFVAPLDCGEIVGFACLEMLAKLCIDLELCACPDRDAG